MQQADGGTLERLAPGIVAEPVDMEQGAIWGCRLLLNREPRDDAEIRAILLAAPSPAALRSWFLHLPEYRQRFETIGHAPLHEPAAALDLRQGIIWGYRLYFQQEPEAAAIAYQCARAHSVRDIRTIFLLSREFALCEGYGAPELLDLEILGRFAPFCTERAERGSFHDFLGARTRLSYLPAVYAFKSGTVEGGPNSAARGIHATAEWIATLRTVLEADGALVAIELGAGWAPWLVTMALAGCRRGITDFTLIAVEGSRDHVAFARQHFRDNGLDPNDHRILHAVVGAEDGVARFPKLDDPSTHYGANALFGDESPSAEHAQWEEVPCISLRTLLADLPRVDIIHCDIQGAEAQVLSAAIDDLDRTVRRIVVGTHSRTIEGELHALFTRHGWHLEFEKSCGVRQVETGELVITIDGEQVWRNPRFGAGVRD